MGEQSRALEGVLGQIVVKCRFVLQILALLAPGQLIKGWLCDVNMAALNEFPHLPEEKGQQQRADVGAVHIGIGHNDDAVVAKLVRIELLLADTATQGSDNGSNLRRAQHFVEPGFLNVQYFPFQGQDCLKFPVSPLLR